MSSRARDYVKGDNPMYRGVTEFANGHVAYYGPYATVAPAKASIHGRKNSRVEICYPVWEPLNES